MTTPASSLRQCPQCRLVTAAKLCPNDGLATIVRTVLDGIRDPHLRVGDVVGGRYRITGSLGRGGFGVVCTAVHTGTGQPVALKYLTVDPEGTEEDVIRRFFQEARITAGLRHPNTVRLFDFGQAENGALYMVMELLHGPTLEQLLAGLAARDEVLSEAATLDIAIPVLKALGEAHDADLVHRDLKPANIILALVPGDEPMPKVLDFGIARVKNSSLTGSNRALGTPAYMSPEQCRGQDIDGRSDLYALGVILYRCVTGAVPYDHTNRMKVMWMHNVAPLPDLREKARTPLSQLFIGAVQQALAKEPADRFADARAMRQALEFVRATLLRSALLRQPGPQSDPQSELGAVVARFAAQTPDGPPKPESAPTDLDLDKTRRINVLRDGPQAPTAVPAPKPHKRSDPK